ncbi:zinc-ribbon and DUF3426 domain-containing protein [Simiduia agarivorans]|uniref:Zinc finger/thioredoxin putative domain-containing protein n=1 Tax=Simiduia agarivorans (strain DSM 21679 / JCM 13881 / BCRC 17597 / SA1) TaxID=1117647 RepID=K4KQ67_SIMAS|nr:zinc-ribbon and DUF3426 domain-containing protein [Simiduia agarivorans]AFV00259.1 hypothetical protein M5M_15630 [Simiduia agarivorans SA1 = DSM 21679]
MTHLVTRCPQCSTSFRITQAQLDRAKGAVRCGSCLQIFRATDHLVKAAPKAAATTKPAAAQASATPAAAKPAQAKAAGAQTKSAATAAPKPAAPAKPAAKPITQAKPASKGPEASAKAGSLQFNQQAIDDEAEWDDDQLIHDDLYDEKDEDRTGELSESFFDIYERKGKKTPATTSLFERNLKEEPEDEPDNVDESWALNILEEAEDDNREARSAAEKQEYSRATTGTFSALTDEDLEAALGDTFRTTGQHKAVEEEEPEPPRRNLFSLEDDDEPEPTREPLFTAMEEIGGEDEHQREKREALRAIELEPLELGFHVESSPWPQRLLWGGLSFAALLAFIVQLGAHNIDTWGRAEATRPYYQAFCPLLGCDLPPMSQPEKVLASNLVVRSHPRLKDALLIDAVLLNKAAFQQPFPRLQIQFSDLQGKPVASRRFTPREYLGGELAGQTIMPSNQPIHIELEILDPGPEAVNYSAHIVP